MNIFNRYQAVLDKPETEEYNDLDRAFELLATLLDDKKMEIGSEETNVIEHAMNFLK